MAYFYKVRQRSVIKNKKGLNRPWVDIVSRALLLTAGFKILTLCTLILLSTQLWIKETYRTQRKIQYPSCALLTCTSNSTNHEICFHFHNASNNSPTIKPLF